MKSPPIGHYILLHLMLAGCVPTGSDAPAPGPNRSDIGEQSVEPARIVVAPQELDFGGGAVGTPVSTAVFTVTNRGGAVAGALAVTVVGSAFVQVSSTCTNALAGGQSCAVTVGFRPTAPGPVSGTLSVSANPGGNDLAGLRGMGQAPAGLSIDRVLVDFPPTLVGEMSPPQTLTVRNTGEAPGRLRLEWRGPTAIVSNFSFTSRCPEALGGQSECQVAVAFTPRSEGAYAGTLVLALDGSVVLGVTLRGSTTEPTAFVLAPPPPFEAMVNATSPPASITVTNGSEVATGPLTVALEGKDLADFTIAGGTCGPPLAPKDACTIEMAFKPSAAGTRTADLVVKATPGGMARAPLVGEARF